MSVNFCMPVSTRQTSTYSVIAMISEQMIAWGMWRWEPLDSSAAVLMAS